MSSGSKPACHHRAQFASMTRQIVIAGGGIGGLAAAVACTRAGWQVQLVEQAAEFAEAGAGIQLGPNATRILQAWGLGDALAAVASEPAALHVRDAGSHRSLARNCRLRM